MNQFFNFKSGSISSLEPTKSSNLEWNKERVEELVIPLIKIGIKTIIELQKTDDEFRITCIVNQNLTVFDKWNNKPNENQDSSFFYKLYNIWIIVEKLPPIPEPPIYVEVVVSERSNPTVKHSSWTLEKQNLDSKINTKINELLLSDSQGNITEGLSSNFMIIKNQKIITCPDQMILKGTIRNLMLKLASETKVPVLFERPNILEVNEWSGACIMSTSRLLLPVNFIIHNQKEYSIPSSSLVTNLKQLLFKTLSKNATSLI